MHNVVPSSPSTRDPVQLLSCISLWRLLEMPEAVPELSNSLFLHTASSLSSLLALQSQSGLWIDSVWSKHLPHQECSAPGHIWILPSRIPTDRCNIGNSASHNHPGHLFLLATTAKLDPWIESVATIIEIFGPPSVSVANAWIKLNHRNVLRILHLFGVFSVRTLALTQISHDARNGQCVASWDWRSSFVGSWGFGPAHAQTCFDSHHGHPAELIDFSHDPAVLGSRLVPNTLCVSRENWFPRRSRIFAFHRWQRLHHWRLRPIRSLLCHTQCRILVCSPWSVSLGQYTSCHSQFYPFHLKWTRWSSRCRSSPYAQAELHVLCQWPQNWRSSCSTLPSKTLVDELGNSVESIITLLHLWTQNT